MTDEGVPARGTTDFSIPLLLTFDDPVRGRPRVFVLEDGLRAGSGPRGTEIFFASPGIVAEHAGFAADASGAAKPGDSPTRASFVPRWSFGGPSRGAEKKDDLSIHRAAFAMRE